jgi:hypothetical protein
MTYKKKITVLSAVIVVLALVYILGAAFEPERRNSRQAAFFWLDSKTAQRIDKITISEADDGDLVLSQKNGKWYVTHNRKDYPARQLRAADFIDLFTRRAPYPVLSNSASSHERLGLNDDSASRVIFSGGIGPSFLDILIGHGDITGKNVYMRRYGQNEVRSGEDLFTAYLSGNRASWYNLRLFPETEDGKLDIGAVQRLTVYRPSAAAQIFTRNEREWTMNAGAEPDKAKVDSYVRAVLYAEAEDFDDGTASDDPLLNDSRIVVELDAGEIRSIRFGPVDDTGRRLAAVSGSDLVYSLAPWMAARFFYDTEYFEK